MSADCSRRFITKGRETVREGKTFLGRGMLGGLLVGAIWSIVTMFLGEYLHSGNIKAAVNYLYLLALPAFIGLNFLVGIVLGALIGAVIWLITKISKKHIGTGGRAIIGTLCTITASGFYSYVTDHGESQPLSLWSYLIYLGAFGIVVGGVPGIIAGTRREKYK